MRILGTRIFFVSFLAGKLWQFEQMILTARSSFSSARSCFGGKLNKCLREDWGKTYSDSQFNSFSFQKRVTLQNVYVYIIQLYSKN